jgi:hypothetical protein
MAFFSLYFLLFCRETELLASIRCDVMAIVSLDDLVVWV